MSSVDVLLKVTVLLLPEACLPKTNKVKLDVGYRVTNKSEMPKNSV